MWITYPIVYNAFECVLQFLLQPIGLQNINNTDVEQQAFALLTASGNATRSRKGIQRTRTVPTSRYILNSRHILLVVDGFTLCLNALHGRGMCHQSLSIHRSVCRTRLAKVVSTVPRTVHHTHLFLLMPIAASPCLASASTASSGSSQSESSASGAFIGGAFLCSLCFSFSATSRLCTPSSRE